MREYILTENEREIIRSYLEKDLRLAGYYQLKSRLRKTHSNRQTDLLLITDFFIKENKGQPIALKMQELRNLMQEVYGWWLKNQNKETE